MGNGSARPVEPALDRVEIVAVLHRYCVAVDERDEGALRSCFAPQASASFNGHLVEGGPDAIAQFLLDSLANPTIDVHDVRSTRHHATTADVRVDGDAARSTSYAVVRLVDDRPTGARLVARGVSYRDRFLRTTDGWRIEHREHRLDWMTTEALTP